MDKLRRGIDRALAVALAGLMSVSPAFAAPFEIPFSAESLQLREWVLSLSLALLAVALALRVLRRRVSREPVIEGPDLRWWRRSKA